MKEEGILYASTNVKGTEAQLGELEVSGTVRVTLGQGDGAGRLGFFLNLVPSVKKLTELYVYDLCLFLCPLSPNLKISFKKWRAEGGSEHKCAKCYPLSNFHGTLTWTELAKSKINK